ncbi:MAG: hypothetical protein QMD46_05380 [Methanomicrobiales archaeon]|nr:hypothetical protein [Methanomicrobiales archaeon]
MPAEGTSGAVCSRRGAEYGLPAGSGTTTVLSECGFTCHRLDSREIFFPAAPAKRDELPPPGP